MGTNLARNSLILMAFLSICRHPLAQVISPSATEVTVSYTASFLATDTSVIALNSMAKLTAAAEDHASHLFGILHSPTMVRKYGLNPNKIEGLGGPRMPHDISRIKTRSVKTNEGEQTEITYSLRGKMLIHNAAAKTWLRDGSVTLPLPYDLKNLYDKDCTDEHYDSLGDYWYFYDPFRQGCTRLSEEPIAKNVAIRVSPSTNKVVELNPRFDLLRGDNGNGSLFSIYTINGFSESATARGDDGRQNYKELITSLKDRGFSERIADSHNDRTLRIFEKVVSESLTVQVKALLVETSIASRGITFAKFFKEAVESADVILYSGHSGLGGNLDIPSLETKAGKYKFNPKKRQLFFFDSCSSYSYYLDSFRSEKTKSKIDVITYGLSSYFATSNDVHNTLLDILMDPNQNPDWDEILSDMEKPLDGASYLLNDGGV